MGILCSSKQQLDGDKFFEQLNVIPAYLKNIKKVEEKNSKKCSLQSIQSCNTIVYKNQPFNIPQFQKNEIQCEFDVVDQNAIGKIDVQKFENMALCKYPHVPAEFLEQIRQYVEKESMMDISLSLFLNRQSYTQLMYILHHYSLVKYQPLSALYLWQDLSCNYEARIQDLLIIFYKHFMANSSQIMHALQIEAPKQYQTLNFQEFLNKIQSLKQHINFIESYPFHVDEKPEDRSSYCSSTIPSHKTNLSISLQSVSKLSKHSFE